MLMMMVWPNCQFLVFSGTNDVGEKISRQYLVGMSAARGGGAIGSEVPQRQL